tara:strand:+ start:361 stop:504 length:144 start_codon:yes stop_codon:yes gene_type:complete
VIFSIELLKDFLGRGAHAIPPQSDVESVTDCMAELKGLELQREIEMP